MCAARHCNWFVHKTLLPPRAIPWTRAGKTQFYEILLSLKLNIELSFPFFSLSMQSQKRLFPGAQIEWLFLFICPLLLEGSSEGHGTHTMAEGHPIWHLPPSLFSELYRVYPSCLPGISSENQHILSWAHVCSSPTDPVWLFSWFPFSVNGSTHLHHMYYHQIPSARSVISAKKKKKSVCKSICICTHIYMNTATMHTCI